MRLEESAGGVVFKRTQKGVRVLVIKNSAGHWAFPKGHIEKGELPTQTAIRETQEEVGIKNLYFYRSLGFCDFWFVDQWGSKKERIHKIIYYFLLETDINAVAIASKKEGIEKAVWVPLKNVKAKITYRDLFPIANLTVKYLSKYNEVS